ncbi:hypothetical protein KC354_g10530 [Hortaea werneckii]|nr:hypothetical protein KC354_g10530 [Hortaea werneckii]
MTDNPKQVSGEVPASMFDLSQPTMAAPPKQVNFPLPRELRDQIYGYLLHHEYTEHSKYPESSTQDAGLPSSYKFHTSILAVNTQICEEATEVLRSNNFVQVTINRNIEEEDLKALEVPIVCDLTYRDNQFDHLRIDYKLAIRSKCDQERKFVVVRLGLVKFCKFLQHCLLRYLPLGPVVLHGREFKENDERQGIRASHRSCQFKSSIIMHDRIGNPLSMDTKRYLLEPFQNLIIGGQSMEINKILPERELAAFKLYVAPPVMNSLPMMWRSFELALEMKAEADQHVLTGHFTEASRLYRHILSTVGEASHREACGTMVLYVLCALVFVDTCLCMALIDLTSSQPMDAGRWLRYSQSVLGREDGIAQALFPDLKIDSVQVEVVYGRDVAIHWLSMLYGAARTESSGFFAATDYFEHKKKVRDIMTFINHAEIADYLDHDVKYLISLIPKNDGTAVEQTFDKSKLSIFQLPPVIFNFPLPDGWSKPVGWFGFLDREMYEDMLSKGRHGLGFSPSNDMNKKLEGRNEMKVGAFHCM